MEFRRSWEGSDGEPDHRAVDRQSDEAPAPLRPYGVDLNPVSEQEGSRTGLTSQHTGIWHLPESVEVDEPDSQEQADLFMAGRAVLREMILQGPIATVETQDRVKDRDQLEILHSQLKLLAVDTSEEMTAGEPLAKELIKIYSEQGGEPSRLRKLLEVADGDPRCPRWVGELRGELVEEAVVPALEDHARNELTEAAVEALAFLLAIPTGPVGALSLAMRLMAAARA